MSTTFRRFGVLALGLLLAAGCAQDRTTGPATLQGPSATASHDLVGSTLNGVTSTLGLTEAKAILRTTPLASDITVTQVIGSGGGTLAIPAAGVTVTVPAGALGANTTLTMTARKGSLLAYDFGPHGTTFAKPLTFTQKLSGTNASVLGAPFIRLGYYPDSSLLGTTTAWVSELLDGVVNLLNWSFTAPLRHFSGYIVLC